MLPIKPVCLALALFSTASIACSGVPYAAFYYQPWGQGTKYIVEDSDGYGIDFPDIHLPQVKFKQLRRVPNGTDGEYDSPDDINNDFVRVAPFSGYRSNGGWRFDWLTDGRHILWAGKIVQNPPGTPKVDVATFRAWGRFAAAGRFRLPGLALRRPLLGSSGCGPFLGCWRPLRGRRAVRPRCLLGGLLSRLWFLLDASVTLAGTVGLGMDGQLVRHKLPAVLQLVDGLGGLALPPLLALVKLAEVLVLHQLGRLPGGKGRLGFAFRPLGLACLGLFLDFLHVVLHIKKRSKCVSN